jgi:hypothetical protein
VLGAADPAACSAQASKRTDLERRQLVIGEDQVDSRVFQVAEVLGASLRTCDFAGNVIRPKELLNERRVGRIILQQKNSQQKTSVTSLQRS